MYSDEDEHQTYRVLQGKGRKLCEDTPSSPQSPPLSPRLAAAAAAVQRNAEMQQSRLSSHPLIEEQSTLAHDCPQEKAARARMVHLLHGLLLKENAAPAALDAIVTLREVFTNALQEPDNSTAQGSRMVSGPPNRSLRAANPVVQKLLSTTGGEALLCTGGFRPKTVEFQKYFVFDPEEAGRTARVTLGVQGGVMPTASDVYGASPSMKAKWRSLGLGVLRTCIAQLAKVEKSACTNAENAAHAAELKQQAKKEERAQLLAAIEADKEARKSRFTYA